MLNSPMVLLMSRRWSGRLDDSKAPERPGQVIGLGQGGDRRPTKRLGFRTFR
jgi:hypothetical protein